MWSDQDRSNFFDALAEVNIFYLIIFISNTMITHFHEFVNTGSSTG